jgi:hypothetical protein
VEGSWSGSKLVASYATGALLCPALGFNNAEGKGEMTRLSHRAPSRYPGLTGKGRLSAG